MSPEVLNARQMCSFLIKMNVPKEEANAGGGKWCPYVKVENRKGPNITETHPHYSPDLTPLDFRTRTSTNLRVKYP